MLTWFLSNYYCTAVTVHFVCQKIRSAFTVLGIYNFENSRKRGPLCLLSMHKKSPIWSSILVSWGKLPTLKFDFYFVWSVENCHVICKRRKINSLSFFQFYLQSKELLKGFLMEILYFDREYVMSLKGF